MTARDDHPGRWMALLILCVAELLAMSIWFTASAVGPHLARTWGLDTSQTGWLTAAVQLGFVAGTAGAALLNLPDLVPARWYFAAAAALGAAANGALCLAPGYRSALALRFLAGVFLAGVYPPGMKMAATWFRSARGLAVGALVGALTVGKATPYLVRSLGSTGFETVVLTATAGGLLGAALVALLYREGPYPFARRPFSWSLAVTVLRDRPTRLAIGGYLGHMWELYAMWTWIPAFVAASLAQHAASSGGASPPAAWLADLIAFGAIAAGGAGCVWGGWMGDRAGRERTVNLAMAVSGACSLLVALAYGASPWLVGAVAWVWGFFVVADSAQFSTIVTEVAPDHAVGTALTLQTSAGFLLTMATIQLVPAIAGAAGWRWAFAVLALGPAAGIAAIQRLARSRGAAPRLASAL